MQNYKIEDFKSDHPNQDFPWYEELSSESCELIKEKITERLNLDEETSEPINMLKYIYAASTEIADENALVEGFDLTATLSKMNIHLPENVYLNWYRFDQIDRMKLADVSKYFDDIWYPGADDVDIVDESLSWLLLVTHDGYLKFLDIPQR